MAAARPLPTIVFLAVALLAGASLGVTVRVETLPWVAGGVGLAVCVCAAAIVLRRGVPVDVVAACLLGVIAGAALGARAARAALAPELASFAGEEPVVLEGLLRDDAVPSAFGVTCTLEAQQVERDRRWQAVSGGVRLTIAGVDAPVARDAWRAGRRLRVTATLRRPLPYRNFDTPDQEIRLAWRGIRVFGAVKSAALVEVLARGSPLAEATAAARAWTRKTVAAAIGHDAPLAAAIVVAVLIGDRAGLPPEIEDRLQRAGTYHVLAISGGNIAVLAGIVLALVGRVGLAPRPRALVVLGVLALYAVAVVGGASVARATLAAAVYLSARALDLRTPALNAVGVTVALLVVATPLVVVDVGFWLTVLASLAILGQAERCADWLTAGLPSRLPPWIAWLAAQLALLVGATIAAEGAVGPVTAYAFGQATLAGLALNVIAVPLMTVVQVAGLALLAAAAIHPVLAVVPAAIARGAAAGIVESASLVEVIPWASWTLVPPPLWLTILAIAAWWALWESGRRPHLRGVAAATWVAAITALALAPAWLGGATSDLSRAVPIWAADAVARITPARRDAPCGLPPPADDATWLRVVALDVGQGDSTLIRFPGGASWLVDAGGAVGSSRFDIGARVVAPALRAQGIRTLDALLLTHADADHVGGAMGLIAQVPPARIWEGVPVPGLQALDGVRRAAASAGAEWASVTAGREIRVGGVDVRVLHPPPPDWERRRPRNDDSLVLEVRLGEVALILPGDAGPAVEATLGGTLAPAALRVLKAAHHGSRASSTAAFLDAVSPAVVVASAGRANRHGHPDPAVLARVRQRGAAFYRTDRDGAVALDTDGRWLRVTTCGGAGMLLDAAARQAPSAGTPQARWMPGRPSSTTSDARVSIEAPGRETNGTMR